MNRSRTFLSLSLWVSILALLTTSPIVSPLASKAKAELTTLPTRTPEITPALSADKLTYSGLAPSSVSLTWGPSGYGIFFSRYELRQSSVGSSGPWATILVIRSQPNATQYVRNLSSGTTYWWEEVDFSSVGLSVTSNVLQVTQPSAARLSSVQTSATSLQLSWTNSATYGGRAAFNSYQVMESLNQGTYTRIANITAVSVTSFTVNALYPSAAYAFYLTTIDMCAGCSSPNLSSSQSNSVSKGGPPTSLGGLLGEYWNGSFFGTTLSGCATYSVPVTPKLQPTQTRTDRVISFGASSAWDWHPFAFGSEFSVKWVGGITAATNGTYSFQLASDDGSWLFLDSQLVLNHGGQHSPTDQIGSVSVYLSQGLHQVEIDYYETCGGASGIEATWIPTMTTNSFIIPPEALIPPPTLDGSATSASPCRNNTCVTFLTTNNDSDAIMAIASCEVSAPSTCSGVTLSTVDSFGLRFHQHGSYCYDGQLRSSCVWEYYTIANSPLINDNITVSAPKNLTIQLGLNTFGVSGANTTATFDIKLPAGQHCAATDSGPADCTINFTTSPVIASPYEFVFSSTTLNDAPPCSVSSYPRWSQIAGTNRQATDYELVIPDQENDSFTCLGHSDPLIIFVDGILGRTGSNGYLGGNWEALGPSPISNCSWGTGGLCSGRVTAIAFDSTHNGTIYLGGAQGGVWKSNDGGSNWTALTDSQPSLAIGSIAVTPNGTLYVGTGEGNFGDSYYGAGLLRSKDGGLTWSRLGSATFGRSTINQIAINPSNPNIILVATGLGSTVSSTTHQSVSPGVQLGIFLSTDGGNSWSPVLQAGFGRDVVFDPSNSSNAYAAVQGLPAQSGIYKSTNGGLSWTALGNGLPPPGDIGRSALAIPASSPSTIFAAMEVNYTGALFKTSNGGSTWTSVPTPPRFCTLTGYDQCGYDLVIAADPSNSSVLYLGGMDLYRSTDGGTTWTDLGGYSGNLHPDQHVLAFSPTSHSMMYVGNDGGVWYSTTADACTPASCWMNLNAGLGLTQFYTIAASPADSNQYFGGTQDNGTPERTSASNSWNQVFGGDGGWTAFDYNNPSTIYASTQYLGLYRSDNGGSSFSWKMAGINTTDRTEFITPVAMDPTTPSTLYLGTYRLYKTINRGESWTLLSPGLVLPGYDEISAIAVSCSNSSYVYVGTQLGHVFMSSDGGTTFAEADLGLPLVTVTQIAIERSSPLEAVVTISSFGTGHVFSTANGGSSWSNVSSNLPDFPANAVTVDSYGNLYVGSDIGVFISTNSGASWVKLGNGLPRVSVVDLVFNANGALVAATHGRGAWLLPLPDFDITGTPATVKVENGALGASIVAVSSLNGFSGPIAFTVSAPISVSCSLSLSTVVLDDSASSVLSCVGPPGFYSIAVEGRSGSYSHSSTISLWIMDYSISASPASFTVTDGSNSTSTVSLVSLGGFSGNVTLTASVSNATLVAGAGGGGGSRILAMAPMSCGPDATFSLQTVLISSNGTGLSTLTVTAPTCVIPGIYVVLVNASQGTLIHVIQLTITVTDPPTNEPNPSPASNSIVVSGTQQQDRFVEYLSAVSSLGTAVLAILAGLLGVAVVSRNVNPPQMQRRRGRSVHFAHHTFVYDYNRDLAIVALMKR